MKEIIQAKWGWATG